AARPGGCRWCRAAPRRSSRGAQRSEEGIAGELGAERRRRAVAGVHDGVGRKAFGELAEGLDERVPVGPGQVGAADGAREEDVAGEEAPAGVVREVTGRVA